MEGQTNIHHCYFAVQGFDMYGADMKKVEGFKNQDQAIAFAKDRIGVNFHLCGVVKRQDNGSYSVSIKPTFKVSPIKNVDTWHRCLNIFYGLRLTAKSKMKENTSKSQFLDHFVASFDMWGGDLQCKAYTSFEEAYIMSLSMIKFDSSKCATIFDVYKANKWEVYLKDPRKANPYTSTNHHLCHTVFVGREV